MAVARDRKKPQASLTIIPVIQNRCCIAGHGSDERTFSRRVKVKDGKDPVELQAALETLGLRLARKKSETCTACGAAKDLWLWTEDPYPRATFKWDPRKGIIE